MQEGLAHICLITSSMTLVRAKIDQVIPRKRKGNVKQHEKVWTFLENKSCNALYDVTSNCKST